MILRMIAGPAAFSALFGNTTTTTARMHARTQMMACRTHTRTWAALLLCVGLLVRKESEAITR